MSYVHAKNMVTNADKTCIDFEQNAPKKTTMKVQSLVESDAESDQEMSQRHLFSRQSKVAQVHR